MTAFTALLTLMLAPPDIIPGTKLLSDIDVLQRSLTLLHPGIYRYNTPAEFEIAVKDLRQQLQNGADLRGSYLAFSEFVAKLKCGHTYANFFNQNERVADQVFAGSNKVPFQFLWLDDRMVVTRDLTGKGLLPAGSEVVALNGVLTKQILERLLRIARADGNNLAKRRRYLSVTGGSKYEAFDIYYPLYFPTKSRAFEVELRNGRKLISVAVEAEDLAARLARYDASRESLKSDGNPWEFRWERPGVAHLRMGTWALFNSKWNWRSYLAEVFEKLEAEKASAIIIDVRGNEGGLSVGDEIIARLIDQPTQFGEVKNYVSYHKVPSDLVPFLDTWDRSFDDRSKTTDPAERVSLANADLYPLKAGATGLGLTIRPKPKRFRGKVMVLVDSANSSATFLFAQQIKSRRLGKLLGETTGGNLRGINGGNFYFLRLPNCGIEIDIPLVSGFPPTPQPDAGLDPDIRVNVSAADIAFGRDRVLQRAFELVEPRTVPSYWDTLTDQQ